MWKAPGTACAPQLLNAHSRTQQASGVLLYCIVHLDDVNFSGVIFDLNGREDQTNFHNKGKFYFWDSHESSGMRPYLRNESETLKLKFHYNEWATMSHRIDYQQIWLISLVVFISYTCLVYAQFFGWNTFGNFGITINKTAQRLGNYNGKMPR